MQINHKCTTSCYTGWQSLTAEKKLADCAIIATQDQQHLEPTVALAKKGYDMVTNVRSGQYLRFNINAENEDTAREIIEDLLNKLRIFNPVTQNFKILNLTKGT